MKSIIQVLAFLPLLATSALAQSPTVNCRTVLGTKSVAKVPTSTTTTTDANRATKTVVVQSTVTTRAGWVSTSTRTKTKTETTTDEAVTDVFESTTTVYDVSTITDEATVVSTSTTTSTTSTTSTTIVATTQGFKNIRDTLNSQRLARRAINHPHAAPEKRAVASGAKGVIAQSYPAAVQCTKTATQTPKTVYTTLRPATKTLAFWLATTITYETQTSTSTVVPDHVTSTHVETSISSVQTTTTTFTTAIEVSTTTTTSSLPGPTLFDACKSDNIFGASFKHNGLPFYASNVVNNGPGVASDFKIMADGASSAVECCAACQNMKTCETYIFRAQNRNCFLLSHDGATCNSQFNHPNYFLSQKGENNGAGYQVGNGNCGYTYSGNSDGSIYSVDPY